MMDPGASPLDVGVLAELRSSVGDDQAFVVELIDAYLSDGAEQLAAIDAAVEGNDAEALVRPAHTLKSSSATLGALRLSAVARQLEVAGRTAAVGAATAGHVAALHAEWDAATDEVADATVYLSEDATYCTGSTLTVDGGWSR